MEDAESYEPPRVTEAGDFTEVTLGGFGTRADGGAPPFQTWG
ncbi:lasso RiPP family leader peptide-containing protein [Streptomyces sp. JH002]|jgi:hypothetical protein|uniref:Lasso RiPP family leader peptide-containing protein n=1 Tax=Streptomyces xiamenensis TaxID=408015 RepID=A0A0F7FP67_9ACTN|nr:MULTISPECIES: lasso RiPP family leader peptide-containing protein [unclassified Streptomyces]AKG41649.1 hypothetical protein SXIM_02650 [Streptomyces xiamenensis]MCU4749536.1 lasso RiPP family leader peptide-containing protein [Streptomyces sp. G-5]